MLKVTINEIPVTLACSEAGKQALNTVEMTLRQRQFILLIKENTSLGEQAVSNLSAVAVKPPTLGGGYKATHTL